MPERVTVPVPTPTNEEPTTGPTISATNGAIKAGGAKFSIHADAIKNLAENGCAAIFAPRTNAALVKGLRRLPFTEESRVRFPYVVHNPLFKRVFLFPEILTGLAFQRFSPDFHFLSLSLICAFFVPLPYLIVPCCRNRLILYHCQEYNLYERNIKKKKEP